jgi:hypothetical protein
MIHPTEYDANWYNCDGTTCADRHDHHMSDDQMLEAASVIEEYAQTIIASFDTENTRDDFLAILTAVIVANVPDEDTTETETDEELRGIEGGYHP